MYKFIYHDDMDNGIVESVTMEFEEGMTWHVLLANFLQFLSRTGYQLDNNKKEAIFDAAVEGGLYQNVWYWDAVNNETGDVRPFTG